MEGWWEVGKGKGRLKENVREGGWEGRKEEERRRRELVEMGSCDMEELREI